VVIINSTILSGAGAIPSLTSLLPDIRKMLLVTDRNIAQLDGVQQIRALLEKHCPQVNVIDNVPAEPTHHDVRQLMDAPGDASFDVVGGIGGGGGCPPGGASLPQPDIPHCGTGVHILWHPSDA